MGSPFSKFSSQRLEAALNQRVASSVEVSHSGWHATPGIHTAWNESFHGRAQEYGALQISRHWVKQYWV